MTESICGPSSVASGAESDSIERTEWAKVTAAHLATDLVKHLMTTYPNATWDNEQWAAAYDLILGKLRG